MKHFGWDAKSQGWIAGEPPWDTARYNLLTLGWLPKFYRMGGTWSSELLLIMLLPPWLLVPMLEWRRLGKGKPKRSRCANMLLFVETVAVSESIKVAAKPMGRSSEPVSCLRPDMAEACVCCCCWSCFVLRNRPPDPLALFIAWRWRDSWRYGWKDTGIS